MDKILEKYYEYFLKLNLEDKQYTSDSDEFFKFYEIIINVYDLKKDKQLEIDMKALFNLFDLYYSFRRIRALYDEKWYFEGFSNASFEWFKASPYLIQDSEFIFSIDNTRDSENQNFCKVYMSIKPEEYINVIIKLQNFINQLFENHKNEYIAQCKFRNTPANDAIVMRFACIEHYHEFLEFLDQNEDIKNSFDIPNLFMPQDSHGLSIIPDNGGSYNYFVTRMIWDYMFDCKNKKINVSIDGLVEFINNYDCSKNEMLNKNGEEMLNNYKLILTGKLLSQSDEELLNIIIEPKSKTLKFEND